MPRPKPTTKADAMADDKDLRNALDRLVEQNQTVASTPATDLPSLLDMLSTEIDETVLSRNVSLLSGKRPVARFELSNRRLIGLDVSEADQKTFTRIDLTTGAVLHALEVVLERAGPLRLGPPERSEARAISNETLTSSDLRAGLQTRDTGEALEAFVQDMGRMLHAWAHFRDGNEMDRENGRIPADQFDLLVSKWQANRNQSADVSKLVSTKPAATLLPFSEGHRGLIATTQHETLLAVIDAEAEAKVITAWQRAFQGT